MEESRIRALLCRTVAGNGLALVACLLFLCGLVHAVPAPQYAQQKRDYLSQNEADKVRDAFTTDDRIQLFIGFAADRLKKLQYELEHPADTIHPEERINGLIIGYSNCLDDASDLIDEGTDHQEDIHKAIQVMQSRAPDFLKYLKKLDAEGDQVDAYKDNLDDAVESTTDAINTANDASKQLAPPPVRRRPT